MPRSARQVGVFPPAVLLLAWTACVSSARAEFTDIRALWVTRFEYSTSSPANVQQVMANAASLGMTDVLFQVRGTADAYYDGQFEPRSERLSGSWDPLQTAVDAAHARGMRLHAWINSMPIWRGTAAPVDPNHIFYNSDPSFRRFNLNGQPENYQDSGPYPINGEYASVNPILPEVHDHLQNVVNDIATNYEVDGVHLDYIRWLGNQNFSTLPHDAQSHAMFNAATGLDGANPANAAAYRTYIKDRITDLVGSLKDTIDGAELATGRTIDLSAAVWRDPDIAEYERLQDYRSWLESDLLDIAMPMIYLSSSNDHLYQPNLSNILGIPTNARVAPAVGVFLHDAGSGGVDLTLTQLQRLYNNQTDGVTFFSYSDFFSDPLAAQRRAAVLEFYDSIEDPGNSVGGLSPDADVLADFELDEGTFNVSPTFSGSTSGVNDATADRTTAQAHLGEAAQLITIDGSGSENWLVRHLSGVGSPANNVPFDTDGFLGFWLKTAAPGVTASIVVDDPESGDRGLARSVVADNQWHLYEWDLDDDTQWEGWVNGDGIITGPTTTLDSIQFFGTGDALLYLDTVAHNPLGSLLAAPVPGDYDGDGVVGSGDYAAWQSTVGATVEPGTGADGNGDGVVGAADYVVWRNILNAQSAAGSSLDSTAVPEPATLLQCVLLAGAVLLWSPHHHHCDG